MQMVNEDDVCGSCGQTFGWHQENNPVHPFNYGQAGATDFLKRKRDRTKDRTTPTSQDRSEGPLVGLMAHDPIVRIALINKGILTPADLVVAEAQLREALAQAKEYSNGSEDQVRSVPTTDGRTN